MLRVFVAPLLSLFAIGAIATPARADFIAVAILLGANERPNPNLSPGTGSATIVFNSAGDTIMYDVVYSGLLANATASHIHVGSASIAGPVVLPFLPGPTGTFGEIMGTLHNSDIINQGITGLTDISQIAAQIQAGNAYVNIHTSVFPGGEIRGQFMPVPEPASLLLVATALGALAAVRCRGRNLFGGGG